MGSSFSILYAMCLYGMYRASLLKIPCYKLMFFNGVLDIVDLFLISSAMAYFHFTGAVFCSSPVLDWIAGHFAYSFWLGSSFNCMVLAINRFVEMIPSVAFLRFLFRGKILYIWIVFSVAYMLMAWFALRPIPFNSAVSAFIATPMIRDFAWEYLHFTSAYQLIHNGSLLIVMTTTYTILCYHLYVSRRRTGRTENYRIFMQVFLICLSTGLTAIGYVLLGFVIVPRSVVIAAHVFWQLSHGVHAIIYLCFNKRIRKEVMGTFLKSSYVEQSTGTAIT
ncbi:unnamed protein product [Cylicocyclus nassatus]|uniref:G protein-coupled receptor n=1 Tax=Cylicocyclus nassatus TaxID=53992 RepID=A0AA36H219_CYLNA|nr:unnamed protein product [Cylicocyclus nassatus]